jgi:hypothetical protein
MWSLLYSVRQVRASNVVTTVECKAPDTASNVVTTVECKAPDTASNVFAAVQC